MSTKGWDVFVSHAWEDKESFVRALAETLTALGVSVWYDEFSLRVGDSLSRSIDTGLASCRFGIVVISSAFMSKPWPEYELRGLVAREIGEARVILPIWHGVTLREVVRFSPPLADKLAINTQGLTAEEVAIRILLEVRPDLYNQLPRERLDSLTARGAFQDLQHQMELMREKLEAATEALREYRCPHCQAPMTQRASVPVGQGDDDLYEEFECGYSTGAGHGQPCPSDPLFPKFEDFTLHFTELSDEGTWRWRCIAIGNTPMAKRLHLLSELGRTREEAERAVRTAYGRVAQGRSHMTLDP